MNTGQDFAIRLRLTGQQSNMQTASGETTAPNVSRVEVFAPDDASYVTIGEKEFTGSKFEILDSLHELGKYQFTLTNYLNSVVETYPRGTIAHEPHWTISAESKKLDYSDYANKVTVHGKTASDGTYNTTTTSDQGEIDALGRTVEKFEKNPEVETQSEVDTELMKTRDAVRANRRNL